MQQNFPFWEFQYEKAVLCPLCSSWYPVTAGPANPFPTWVHDPHVQEHRASQGTLLTI